MDILTSILLGAVQGLTEFLPVSSSGHLVLFQHALDGTTDEVFVLLVHIATLLAVIIYFRKDIRNIVLSLGKRGDTSDGGLLTPLIIATIPAAVVGMLFESYVDKAFESQAAVACALAVTGMLLIVASRRRPGEKTAETVGLKGAAMVGFFQAMALFPGISRSGSTIAGGIFNDMDPAEAARFSFLLSIPAIGGATLLKIQEIAALDAANTVPYMAGMLVAFVSGAAGIHLLMRAVTHGRLHMFGYYCIAIAIAVAVMAC